MNVNVTALVTELRVTLTTIDTQIEAMKKDVWRHYPVHIKPSENSWASARYPSGEFMFVPLLTARAQILSALAHLQTPPPAKKTVR